MPDKKLTDNEIVKAWECCMDEMGCIKGCPCFDPKAKGSHCTVSKKLELEKLTLDLINRLQAKAEFAENINHLQMEEMQSLQAENERLCQIGGALLSSGGKLFQETKAIKAEAYKEFAELAVERVEKAKAKYQRLCKEQGEEMEEHMHIHFNGITKIINNLLKELVGEDNATQ